MRVLVVDDSVIMRRIISNNLKTAGFTDIVEANNGAEAMENLSGVELILTDWNMPVMDGLSFVKEVRKNGEYSKIPIVMITTEGAKTEVMEALKSGVNNYIVKPFTPETLVEKINSTLAK
ncbi:MAG: response regulator [Candidatus Zixiibacteriota bacterium]|nr:MAG: response regulator [candidate division Zixibacteria bacterium]